MSFYSLRYQFKSFIIDLTFTLIQAQYSAEFLSHRFLAIQSLLHIPRELQSFFAPAVVVSLPILLLLITTCVLLLNDFCVSDVWLCPRYNHFSRVIIHDVCISFIGNVYRDSKVWQGENKRNFVVRNIPCPHVIKKIYYNKV